MQIKTPSVHFPPEHRPVPAGSSLPGPVGPKPVRVGLARDAGAKLDGPLHQAGRALQAQEGPRDVPQHLLVADAPRLLQVVLLQQGVRVV